MSDPFEDMDDAQLAAAVQEGLRLRQEQVRAEWEAMSVWGKLAELWRDMPWTGRIAVFLGMPLMVLAAVAMIVIGMVTG